MIQFMASKFKSSSRLSIAAKPSSAFFVIFIAINNSAIITGKLNTAIRILLLLAFEAIAEIRLSDAEKAGPLSTIFDMYAPSLDTQTARTYHAAGLMALE